MVNRIFQEFSMALGVFKRSDDALKLARQHIFLEVL
jgi:hypothetical protein